MINKITAKDKLLHFIVGFTLYIFFNLFFGDLTSLLLTALVAGLKELYDYVSKKGNAELLDFIMTNISGLIMYLMF